jgi:ABC-type transport system substrate-binding protein
MQRMMNPNEPESAFLRRIYEPVIASVEATSPTVVTIKAKKPYAPMLPMLAHLNAYMVPREAVEKFGDLKGKAVGTGPFVLRNFERGKGYYFERHPAYFKQGRPFVDKLEYLVVPDPALQISSIRTGQLQIAGVSQQQFQDLRNSNLQTQKVEGYTGNLISINRRDTKAFQDARVRRAISLAMDRDAIISSVLQGEATKYVLLPAVMQPWQLPKDEVNSAYKLDVTQAKQLLQAAGYGGGLEMKWQVPGQQQPTSLATLEVLQQQLAPVGIKLGIDNMEYTTWQKALVDLSFTATVSGNRPYQDPDLYTWISYHPDSNEDAPSDDAEFNQLLVRQRETFDVDARRRVIHDIQRKMFDLNYTLFIYDPNTFSVWQRNVRDFAPTGVTGSQNLAYVWFAS